MSEPKEQPDAGLRSHDHYKSRLPKWRYDMREALIPIVRWETPCLARIQERVRSPALDSYFAFAANLGTHTFFMMFLPALFWCGFSKFGRGMTHMLAAGVLFSGYIKDFLCLPRPLSPPLQRISRSASVALEYGFPSTHSTNSVSVAVYVFYMLQTSEDPRILALKPALQGLCCFYAITIVLGRLYCGMHGFFDVVWGLLLGLVIAVVQCLYGEDFDNWIYSGPFLNVVIVTLVVLVLVRMHPEPADDCPCFDDSVSFSAVFIGIQLGAWHFVRSGYSWDQPVPSTTPFDLEALGWAKNLARIMLGIFIVFTWRGITKPILLRILPPIFRVIEHLGLSLPRKFFLPATEYKRVPPLRKDDNVIPPVSEIPRMITSLRHPRKRAISIGPQSEADAYEALAFRDSRRRQSLSSPSPPSGRSPLPSPTKSPTEVCTSPIDKGVASSDSTGPGVGVTVNATVEKAIEAADADSSDAKDDHEMFLRLLKPRVRYDVEVVTKLIVYTGIAWLSVAGNAIIFELCGLGMGKRP